MKWISHEDRTLEEHLLGLKEVATNFLREKEQAFFTFEELKEQVFALIANHDLAKASIYFRLYLSYSLICSEKRHRDYSKEELEQFIRENKVFFYKWKENPSLKNHSLFGAWMSLYFWGKEIVYSINNFLFLSILKSHHGHLKDFQLRTMNPKGDIQTLTEVAKTINLDEYDSLMKRLGLPFYFGDMSKLLNSFKARKFDQLVTDLSGNKDSSFYFKTLFLYSFLLSADKGDMMLQKKKLQRVLIKSKIIDSFKSRKIQPNHPINKWREEAYQISVSRVKSLGENNFYSITLPTGLGKTLTAYKAALKIKETYSPEFRIVYCLPFTSVIDQNAKIFKHILDNAEIDPHSIGVHHHLSIPDIKDDEDQDEGVYPNWEYLTEGWQNEITITTFVQLWESIFACHNSKLRKFHNLVNSIIILDEVQSINPKLFPAFEFAIECLASYFNTKFIFVTATQPILLSDKMKELAFKNKDDYFFSKMGRTIIDTSFLKQEEQLNEKKLAEIILKDYEDNKHSILVICNTIRYSQNLIKILAKFINNADLFYLSASIIPYSRTEILDNQVKIKLDKNEPIILVSTQVVEAGVDIDFDTVYRDFAPLPSINQAAGRGNRNGKKGISRIVCFRSGKEKIYDPTQLDITKNVLSSFPTEIPECKFFELNQQYFKAIKEKIQKGSDISNAIIKDILTLQFENIGSNSKYRLFVEKYKTYSYFIPINQEAEAIWSEYIQKFEVKDNFRRKQAIKLIMPKLTQFVVKIPDYIVIPNQEEQEMAIINRNDWDEFYNETYGYKIPDKTNSVELF